MPALDGALVLDLGAGGGRHARWLAARGATVVAGDLSVEGATSDEGASSLAWVRLDAGALPFRDSVFDVVVLAEVLEHVEDPLRVLEEAGRVVRNGGWLVVSVPAAGPEAVAWALSLEYHAVAGGHVRIVTRRWLLRALRASGFDVRSLHRRHALHTPYWWLRCLLGIARSEADPVVRWWGWRLVAAAVGAAPRLAALEELLDPVLGKSLVVYASRGCG